MSPAVLLMVTTATPLEVVVNDPLANGSVRRGTSSSELPTYDVVGVGVLVVLIMRGLATGGGATVMCEWGLGM